MRNVTIPAVRRKQARWVMQHRTQYGFKCMKNGCGKMVTIDKAEGVDCVPILDGFINQPMPRDTNGEFPTMPSFPEVKCRCPHCGSEIELDVAVMGESVWKWVADKKETT